MVEELKMTGASPASHEDIIAHMFCFRKSKMEMCL